MAKIELFKLLGSIFVNNDEANKNIDNTEKKAGGLVTKMGEGIKTAGKWGAAIGAGALAGGTALLGMAKGAADTTDRIDKMSQKIGISRTGFQELEYILSQNGTDIEKMQVGFKTLTQRMGEATEGTGKGAEAFAKLNLQATDLNGNLKSQEQMFDETAKALMKMPEGAEKSQMAFDLFGKAGLELMPLLNGSAEGMDDLRQAANDMGLVLSDEAVGAGADFTDTMDNVERSLGAVVANIGVKVMPMFDTFLNWILDHMPEIQKVMGIVFDAIGIFVMAVVDIFTDYLMPAFQIIFDWTKENWPAIQKIIETVFKAIKTVWDKILKPTLNFLWDIFKGIVKWVVDNWPTIQKNFETVFKAIKFVWDRVLKPVLDFLLDAFKAVVKFVADKFGGMQKIVENTFEGIGKAVSKVSDAFGWLTDKISGAWDWLTKWNKTDVKDKDPKPGGSGGKVDGSHKSGLSYVPFDGYIAETHKGEEILTADDPRNQNNDSGSNNSKQELTINTPVYLDGKKITTVTSRVQLQNNKGKARALGVVPS